MTPTRTYNLDRLATIIIMHILFAFGSLQLFVELLFNVHMYDSDVSLQKSVMQYLQSSPGVHSLSQECILCLPIDPLFNKVDTLILPLPSGSLRPGKTAALISSKLPA